MMLPVGPMWNTGPVPRIVAAELKATVSVVAMVAGGLAVWVEGVAAVAETARLPAAIVVVASVWIVEESVRVSVAVAVALPRESATVIGSELPVTAPRSVVRLTWVVPVSEEVPVMSRA